MIYNIYHTYILIKHIKLLIKQIDHDNMDNLNTNAHTELDDTMPVFYSEEEISQIQKKIKYFMKHKDEISPDNTNDDMVKGCMVTALMANHAKENNYDKRIVSAYIDYPPFIFYTDEDHKVIRRIYGMAISEDETMFAHAVTAMCIINNDIIGGIELEKCIHVKDWSPSQKSFLSCGLVKGSECFTDPFGFIAFLPK